MNPYKKLISMLPSKRVDVGTVTDVFTHDVRVTLQSGGVVIVRGTGYAVGSKVYIEGGEVIGAAPAFPDANIDPNIEV